MEKGPEEVLAVLEQLAGFLLQLLFAIGGGGK